MNGHSVMPRRRIGVFVGSFNPPHLAHLCVASDARDRFSLDHVYVVTDRLTKYKQLVDIEHRQRMVELMFAGVPQITTRMDHRLEAALHAAELWDHYVLIESAHPHDEVYLILGTSTLHWYVQQLSTRKIPPVPRLIISEREADVSVPMHALTGCLVHRFVQRHQGASSTRVREQLARGTPVDLLTPEVDAYIRIHGLYGTGNAHAPVLSGVC